MRGWSDVTTCATAARSVPGITTPRRKWSEAQRPRVVLAAWRAAAEMAREDPSGRREAASLHAEMQRLRAVVRELRR